MKNKQHFLNSFTCMAKKRRLLKWYLGMEGNVYAQGIGNVKKNSQQSTFNVNVGQCYVSIKIL